MWLTDVNLGDKKEAPSLHLEVLFVLLVIYVELICHKDVYWTSPSLSLCVYIVVGRGKGMVPYPTR